MTIAKPIDSPETDVTFLYIHNNTIIEYIGNPVSIMTCRLWLSPFPVALARRLCCLVRVDFVQS